jgi:hypothetical protein
MHFGSPAPSMTTASNDAEETANEIVANCTPNVDPGRARYRSV